jgi:hypothetical protein
LVYDSEIMASLTPQKIEQDLLELIMFEDNIKCTGWAGQTCENDATHVIICPCKIGRETMCASCLAKARGYTRARFFGLIKGEVWFSDSCGHTPKFVDCAIHPL